MSDRKQNPTERMWSRLSLTLDGYQKSEAPSKYYALRKSAECTDTAEGHFVYAGKHVVNFKSSTLFLSFSIVVSS